MGNRLHFLNANFRRLASLHLSDFRVREGLATIQALPDSAAATGGILSPPESKMEITVQ